MHIKKRKYEIHRKNVQLKLLFLIKKKYLAKEALSFSRDIQATALTGDACPGITRRCLPFDVQICSLLS